MPRTTLSDLLSTLVRRYLRASLLVISAISILTAIGGGATITAQRYASAHAIAVVAPADGMSLVTAQQIATLSQPVALSQHVSRPVIVKSCACAATHQTVTLPVYPMPQVGGQLVEVSIAKQWLWAYQGGQLVLSTAVTTGMPQLPTPRGTFQILMKESNVMFYSPWPPGSPYYYTPEFVPYAMLFLGGGFYLHAAPWRHAFGPGTNVPHTDPDGTWETGSHGCVNLPVSAASALYSWIGVGATVVITA